jgi:hypothetical protein
MGSACVRWPQILVLKWAPPIGLDTVHHGPILVVLEAAALDIAKAAAGQDCVIPSALSCRIVRPGRKGPFKISSSLLNRSAELISCRSVMRDEGRDKEVISIMMWQARISKKEHEQ